MSFARGDSKPCSYSGCDGTMRFSKFARRAGLDVYDGDDSRAGFAANGEKPGWVCDTDVRHFEGTALDTVWHA
jgi:hypothetical protein